MTDADQKMYGCSVAKLRQETEQNSVFQKSGPVIYATSLMDRAMALIGDNNSEPKFLINRAKWVLIEYVLGDDE